MGTNLSPGSDLGIKLHFIAPTLKNLKRAFIALALITSLPLISLSSSAHAGTLDNFKKDTKKNKSSSSDTNKSRRNRTNKSNDHYWDNFFFRFLYKAVELSALTSNERVYLLNSAEHTQYQSNNNHLDFNSYGAQPRHLGDPDLPFLQLEGQFHNVWGDTSALNYKATIGYGMFAYKYEQHFYRESSPKSDLTITKNQYLLRLSIGNDVEIHQGLGNSIMTDQQGFRHEEMLYTSPVKIKLGEQYLVEFAPTWTSSYDEYDFSISKYQPYYSYKLGYKIPTTGNTSLDGIYLGISVQY